MNATLLSITRSPRRLSPGVFRIGVSIAAMATIGAPTSAYAAILFDQMTNFSEAIITSSWVPPDGTDSDTYSYDNFLLTTDSVVEEVWWVGGGGNLTGLTVRFYEGLASAPDYQPKITALPEEETPADYLKGYRFTGNGNQTTIPGSSLFQYHVLLPEPLALPGNTVFWVKIEGDVTGFPFWGLGTATHGRDARHFKYTTGLHMFQIWPNSEAFQLVGTPVPEPATMTVVGLALLGLRRRRR